MDFAYYVKRQKDWSLTTLGRGRRTEGIIKHIQSELEEIKKSPLMLEEWIDVIILAIDGAWRMGFTSDDIEAELMRKQTLNIAIRKWPAIEVSEANESEPIYHIKEDNDATKPKKK